jgi:hypothetical protein
MGVVLQKGAWSSQNFRVTEPPFSNSWIRPWRLNGTCKQASSRPSDMIALRGAAPVSRAQARRFWIWSQVEQLIADMAIWAWWNTFTKELWRNSGQRRLLSVERVKVSLNCPGRIRIGGAARELAWQQLYEREAQDHQVWDHERISR